MKTLRFVLGDQLTRNLSSLRDIDAAQDVVLIVEVMGEATYVRHHKQKIAFLFSAMRHFAQGLRDEGIAVDYVTLDESSNTQSFGGELERAVARHQPDHVVITEPGEWRVWEMMLDWRETLGAPLEIRGDDRFICSREAFSRWAEHRKGMRMEFFYREMRRATGYLMRGDEPEGGRWNFDPDNRKALPATVLPPQRLPFEPDSITQDVMALVGSRFADHFGDLDSFCWAVTRADALTALAAFVDDCLPRFGDYQDAMKAGEDFLFHAVISPYINCSLLTARECCEAALFAYDQGHTPLNAVEGFIRQIIGWREYVRGVYWLKMPDYASGNALGAARDLPWFYWSGETELNCLKHCIGATQRHAYAHHIQRLMVTGNFALLIGVEPRQIEEWYLVVYADAYDWVELPNVHGMVMFADGGLLASKPYAASGAYIDRMSDYCAGCRYDPKLKSGKNACPFNYLYWNFLIENQAVLAGNQRLAMPYRNLTRFSAARRAEIERDASMFLASL